MIEQEQGYSHLYNYTINCEVIVFKSIPVIFLDVKRQFLVDQFPNRRKNFHQFAVCYRSILKLPPSDITSTQLGYKGPGWISCRICGEIRCVIVPLLAH